MHQTRDTHRIRYLKVWKIFLLLHCEFENGKYQVRVVPISLSLYTSKHSSAATPFPLVLKTINFVLEVLIAILFDRSQFDGYYSGRGNFMPLPLKSKILETPMFPLWLRTLNLLASLMVQCDLSRIRNYSAIFLLLGFFERFFPLRLTLKTGPDCLENRYQGPYSLQMHYVRGRIRIHLLFKFKGIRVNEH